MRSVVKQFLVGVIILLVAFASISGLAACNTPVSTPSPPTSNESSSNISKRASLGPKLEQNILKQTPSGNLNDTLLAFSYYQKDNDHIFTMKSDGTSVKQITFSEADDINPEWSPDGLKIAFQSNRDGNWEIYVMNADGSKETRLTFDSSDDEYPTWSPDGSKIAFVSSRYAEPQIMIMKADGSGQTRITKEIWHFQCPAWSPDGSAIACSASSVAKSTFWGIYLVAVDGSKTIQLTPTEGDINPAWSPDGSIIAYQHFDQGYQIWIMDKDGANRKFLAKGGESGEYYPAWSPDGTKIVFSSARSGHYEFYLMNPDGSSQTKISNLDISSSHRCSWSPFLPESQRRIAPGNIIFR